MPQHAAISAHRGQACSNSMGNAAMPGPLVARPAAR